MMRYRTYEGAPWAEVPYSMYWMSHVILCGYEYQIKGRDYA